MIDQSLNDITAQDIIKLLERQERRLSSQDALLRLCAAYLAKASNGQHISPQCHVFNELKEAGYGN